jgi:mannose-1-phosphate guanylyltransferase
MPETEHTLTATYADDTAILASHQNPITVSTNLQNHLNQFETRLKQLRIKANENKSTHVTFSLKRETCPAVTLNGQHIPQEETDKYLGLHLDRRLTWQKHIFTKRKQLGLKLHRMYWIIGS